MIVCFPKEVSVPSCDRSTSGAVKQIEEGGFRSHMSSFTEGGVTRFVRRHGQLQTLKVRRNEGSAFSAGFLAYLRETAPSVSVSIS
jgi:hypothetical protein